MAKHVSDLFDRMDQWRHLPNYQLERRADLFFSLYLPEALEARLGIKIHPLVVPEFPVRIGTIYPHIATDKSVKLDYVCFSADLDRVIFVELKTESLSRRQSQDRYLVAAQQAGFEELLRGLLRIFQATQAKRKYFHLLRLLEQVGCLKIPPVMHEIVRRDSLIGINQTIGQIEIRCKTNPPEVIYLQPRGDGDDVLSFTEFKKTVREFADPISQRFASSLSEWAEIQAGTAKIDD